MHRLARRKDIPGAKTVRSTWIWGLSVHLSPPPSYFGKKGSCFGNSVELLHGIYSHCRTQQSAWSFSQCSPIKNSASSQPASTTIPAQTATGSTHPTTAAFHSCPGSAHSGPGHTPAPAATPPQAATAAAAATSATTITAASRHILPAAAAATGTGSTGKVVRV